MEITFDPATREPALRERGLDFLGATDAFTGPTFTFEDERFDYPEVRFVTADGVRRIISMRKANAREQARFRQQLGEAGRDDR